MTPRATEPGGTPEPEPAPSTPDGAAPGRAGETRLRRDRVTAFSYAALCAWGWYLYSFGVIVPLLREEQGTTRALAALHSTASAGGGVVAGLLVAALVRRLRRRGAAGLGSLISVAGVGALLVGSPTALTLGAAFVTGFGGALLANVTIPVIIEHHGASGTAALSEGNGFAAGVALVAPLAVGATVWLGWGWQPALALYLPLLALAMWLLWRVPPGVRSVDGDLPLAVRAAAHEHPSAAGVPAAGLGESGFGGRGRLPRSYWPYVIVIMCSVGVEFTMATWSGDLVVDRTGVSAAQGAAMVSLVLAGMAAGRFTIGSLARSFAEVPLLLAAFALTFTGWLIVWTSSDAAIAALGLALTGLGIAGQYPLAMTLCVRAAPGLSDKAVGVAGSAIGVAIGIGPFALGALADATDIHTAFVVVPTLIAVAAIVLVLVRSGAAAHDAAQVP